MALALDERTASFYARIDLVTWVKIDDQFPEHPKIVAVGPLGQALQVAAICYSARQLTDGHVPSAVVPRLIDLRPAAIAALVVKMVDVGLWEQVPGGYAIHDYLVYNSTRKEVVAAREQKSAAGKASANKRWGKRDQIQLIEG